MKNRLLWAALPALLASSGLAEAKDPKVDSTRTEVANEATKAAEVNFLGISEVSEENADVAKKSLKAAYEKIRTEIAPKLKIEAEKSGATYEEKNGYALVKDLLSKGFDENDYLPLMIKESRLNPNAKGGNGSGYFQIEPIIQTEIKMYYGYQATNAYDPVQNSILGILTLHRMRNHYAENEVFKDLNEADKDLLGYAIYNKGFQTMKTLFEASGAKTYKELEGKISDALVAELEPSAAKKGPASKLDGIYNVSYLEYQGVELYLKHITDSKLNSSFKLNGKDTGLDLRRAGIVLRYPRLIEGIQDKLISEKVDQVAPVAPDRPVNGIEKATTYENRTVAPGDTLWKFSREYGLSTNYIKRINGLTSDTLSVGQVLRVPTKETYAGAIKYFYKELNGAPWIQVVEGKGFYSTLVANEKYNAYLAEQVKIDKSDIEEIIIDFNIRFNPELKNVNDKASNIPKGAQIWVPNAQYFLDSVRGIVEDPSVALKPIPKPELPKPDNIPSVPALIGEIPPALDKVTSGQYVKKINGVWVRDVEAMKKGAERFATKKWEQHPAWNEDYKKEMHFEIKKVLRKLRDVRHIVLHSTISSDSNGIIKSHKAHFVVERDGSIKYLVPIDKDTESSKKYAHHAGTTAWDGLHDLSEHSIGIEVVALEGQSWSEAEYVGVKKLVDFIGGYYNLQKNDVLLHKMPRYSEYGRGEKSDPCDDPSVLYSKLGLPDNSRLMDLDVAQGDVLSNIAEINGDSKHVHGSWFGLDAGQSLLGKNVPDALPKMDQATLAKWKEEVRAKANIVKYTVQKGDTLYEIAKENSTTVEIIQAYNSLKGITLSIGQVLEVPKAKD